MTTTATTFAEYAEANGWPPDSEYRDAARVLWEQEKKAQASYPATIPPCPSWCDHPAGHEYDSYESNGNQGVVHTRCHERSFGAVDLLAFEYNDGIEARVDAPAIDCQEQRLVDLSSEHARGIAAALLAAADFLDTITAQ